MEEASLLIGAIEDHSKEYLLGFIVGFIGAVASQRIGWWGDRQLVQRSATAEAQAEFLKAQVDSLKRQLERYEDNRPTH